MKRFVGLCLVALLFLSVFGGCDSFGDTTKNNSSDTDVTNTDTINSESDLDEETSENQSALDQEILNSVLSSLEDNFKSPPMDTGYTFYNFIDDQTGYFFYLIMPLNSKQSDNELLLFMKTTDGGNTWYFQTVNSGPSIYYKERIICAKMITENVGLVSGKYLADQEIRNRTYITLDGGYTWYPPNVNDANLWNAEAYDMIFQNSEYILYFRERYFNSQSQSYEYKYYKSSSKDLQTWTISQEIN